MLGSIFSERNLMHDRRSISYHTLTSDVRTVQQPLPNLNWPDHVDCRVLKCDNFLYSIDTRKAARADLNNGWNLSMYGGQY